MRRGDWSGLRLWCQGGWGWWLAGQVPAVSEEGDGGGEEEDIAGDELAVVGNVGAFAEAAALEVDAAVP